MDGLRSFIKKISTRAHIIGIVTDPERITPKALKRFGKVKRLTPDDLVSYDD